MFKSQVIISSDRRIAQLETFKLTEHLYIVNGIAGPTGPNGQVVGVQGFGAIGNQPVSTASDLEDFVRKTPRYELIETWSKQARGAVTLSLFEPIGKTVRMLPDPLGGSIVFYYDKDGVRAASANLLELVRVLRSIGVKLKKSLQFALELVISTNGGLSESSYEDIKSLNILSYLTINRESLLIEKYSGVNFSKNTSLSYGEMIDSAADEIVNTVTAASQLNISSRICHLTGGFDSRLVAAATTKAGVSDSYRYFCQGDAVLPDKKLAENVAAELGLTMTNFSGISTTFSPTDFGGGLVGPMTNSAGLLSVGPHIGNSFSDTLILSGGYGGTFRSTYDYRFLDRPNDSITGKELGTALWGQYLFAGGQGSLLNQEYSNFLASKIDDKMNQGRDLGVREDALGDMFYIQTRARYFISHITSAWNSYIRRIDPLYSPVAIHGALTMPLKERAGNSIGYDLALKLDRRILEYPFDTEKFNLSVLGRELEVDVKEFSGKKVRYDKNLNQTSARRDFGYLQIPKATSEDIIDAKRMNARAYQVSGRNAARESLNEMLGGIKKSEIGDLVNLDEINILRKRPANTRVRMRTLFNLYSSLAWYFDENDTSSNAMEMSRS